MNFNEEYSLILNGISDGIHSIYKDFRNENQFTRPYLFLIEIFNDNFFSNFHRVVICDSAMSTQIQQYQYVSKQQQKIDVHFRFLKYT